MKNISSIEIAPDTGGENKHFQWRDSTSFDHKCFLFDESKVSHFGPKSSEKQAKLLVTIFETDKDASVRKSTYIISSRGNKLEHIIFFSIVKTNFI